MNKAPFKTIAFGTALLSMFGCQAKDKKAEQTKEKRPFGIFDEIDREFARMHREMKEWGTRLEQALRVAEDDDLGTFRVPQAHVREEKNAGVVSMYIPGVTSTDDITIDLEEGMLVVKAKREEHKKDKSGSGVSESRSARYFHYSTMLPDSFETDDLSKVKATFKEKDQKLVLEFPLKKQKLEEKKNAIKIVTEK